MFLYRNIYVESMGKTVFNLFKSYFAQLMKLDANTACKSDTIAVEEATLKNMFAVTKVLSLCSVVLICMYFASFKTLNVST